MTMTIIICPECGAKNGLTASRCHQCDASLIEVEPIEPLNPEDSDHLPSAEEDLPGLLNALKNDKDSQPVVELDKEKTDEVDRDSDESAQEEDVPEWLLRIRQRAQEEKDAIGPITQKISAAEASLLEENKAMQRQNFESWIQQIKEQAQDDEIDSIDAFVEEEMPDWLRKIRQSGETPEAQERDLTPEGGEQTIPMLDWIGTQDVEPLDGQPKESELEYKNLQDLPEETIQMPVDTATDEIPGEGSGVVSDVVQAIGPILTITPEEEIQADHLLATITAESVPKRSQKQSQEPRHWLQRILFNLGLILIITLIALWGGRSQLTRDLLQPQNEAVISWAQDLPKRATILVIMDTQAGFYSEISMIAKPVIENVASSEREFLVLSSAPIGNLLFNRMISELELSTSISAQDLGYFPIAAYGAFGLGGDVSANWRIANLPQSEKALPVADYDGIIVLADSIVGAKAWVEQLSALMPGNQLILFLTAQAGPMLLPYYDSGQVSGIISGISEAAGVEAALAQSSMVADRWQLYQIGIWLMLVVLIVSPFIRIHNGDTMKGVDSNEPG